MNKLINTIHVLDMYEKYDYIDKYLVDIENIDYKIRTFKNSGKNYITQLLNRKSILWKRLYIISSILLSEFGKMELECYVDPLN